MSFHGRASGGKREKYETVAAMITQLCYGSSMHPIGIFGLIPHRTNYISRHRL
jgi:hypothetical protein